MGSYTIKLTENEELFLQNEQGEEVASTDLLKQMDGRRVIAFDGEMGAGKTTFIKQLCKDLGSDDVVNSPTFAIVNVYDYIEAGQQRMIYHFDCYRLKDIREAIDFGAEDYLYSGDYCFIEWPQQIETLLPDDTVYVRIQQQEDGSRQLTIAN